MRQRELRIALICYGGISLAVYMHGITKEVWRLARASRAFHDGTPKANGSQGVYRDLLEHIAREKQLRMRVLPDIITGASAGGINGVFLAQAIATGQSLEPLTRLWLECADIDVLLDADARPLSRFSKFWAQPLVRYVLARSGGAVERTVAPETRSEVRRKMSRLIRARWFAPPFSGTGFSTLLYNALAAMAKAPHGPQLLPRGQPLDLFVTVTDFYGHLERLRLHSRAQRDRNRASADDRISKSHGAWQTAGRSGGTDVRGRVPRPAFPAPFPLLRWRKPIGSFVTTAASGRAATIFSRASCPGSMRSAKRSRPY